MCMFTSTSGSTGVPKGVLGRNEGLSHFVDWEVTEFGVDPSFRFSQFTNPGFDVFMRDIFVPLCAGGTICVPGEDHLSTGGQISDWIESNKITLIHCVPSFFKLFTHQGLDEGSFSGLRYILLAGEKIAPYELRNWYHVFRDRVQLVNIYGPTETTLAKGCYRIQPEDSERGYIPIKAIPGAQFLLLDQYLNLCPQEAVGEIYIRTPYRSAGYLNVDEVSENPFITNPMSDNKGDVVYKTGDLGRMHKNGEMEILGRVDHQIKIRGIRIELDDIKENILKYPGVSNTVVTAKQDEHGEKFICAYIVSKEPLDLSEVKDYLNIHLPRNMVPSYLVPLSELPLLPNGKVNRKALPHPEISRQEGHLSASNEIEKALVEIWSQVLKVDEELIGIDQNFFDLGGHSIRAVSLINKIQQVLGVKVELRDIFSHPSIQDQYKLVSKASAEDSTLILRVTEKEYYKTSPAQERMYYQHLLHKESTAFNISMPIRIKETLDIDRIKDSFQKLVDRHESLRTSFIFINDRLVQKINDGVRFELELIEQNGSKSSQDLFYDFIRPFDLSAESLMRCGLVQHETEGNLLFMDIHHIICDGASLNILVNDFKRLYLGEELPPLELRYIDYSHWINRSKGELEKQREFWMQKLSGELPKFNLHVTTDQMDTGIQRTATKMLELDGTTYLKIKNCVVTHDVSEFMFLLSVYFILLNKVSGSNDVILGTDSMGRTQSSLKDVIGTFVNILPLRIKIEPDGTFIELLKEVKACVLDAYDNQDFQFDQMVSLLNNGKRASVDEIIEFHFSFSNILEDEKMEGFEYASIRSKRNEVADYGFKMEAQVQEGKLNLSFIYNTELYEDDIVNMLMEYYHNIVRDALENENMRVEDLGMEQLLEETI